MLTKEALIAKIPRTSNGKIKGEEGRRLERLISSYRYSEQELAMIETEINGLVQHYGHEGVYAKGSRKFSKIP